jgi:hypothetical protein
VSKGSTTGWERKTIMKDRDKLRFQANITWFNQFFDGLRQIYEQIAELLPVEYFPHHYSLGIENYYFPDFKAVPCIPPYYALMLEGKKCALQVVSVVDESLFAKGGKFDSEPSMVIVVHSREDKYSRLDEFALQIIKNQTVEQVKKAGNIVRGQVNHKFPADFFAFQVKYDRFSDANNPEIAIGKYIIDPIAANLAMGFPHTKVEV